MSNVNEPAGGFSFAASDRKLATDLLRGRSAMLEAGTAYMPRYATESETDYSARLHNAILDPIFEDIIEEMIGMPFRQPVTLTGDVGPTMTAYKNDIDLLGSSLHDFAVAAFQKSLPFGYCGILTDHPEALPEGSTRADEMEQGNRPYAVLIDAEDIIDARGHVMHGQFRFTHIRIRERSVELTNGFKEQVVNRVRVLVPGRFELWKDTRSDQASTQVKWIKETEGTTSLDYVPFRLFKTGNAFKGGALAVRPALASVADINRAHWASEGDQRNILSVARFPILFMKGFENKPGETVKIKPKTVLVSSNAAADVKWVEHTGAAIEAGRQDLNDMRDKAMRRAVQLLSQPTPTTATQSIIDTAAAMSPAQRMMSKLESDLRFTLKAMADYAGEKFEGDVEIDKNFGDNTTLESFKELLKMRAVGDLSHETLLNEAKRRNILDRNTEVGQESDKLEKEGENGVNQ